MALAQHLSLRQQGNCSGISTHCDFDSRCSLNVLFCATSIRHPLAQ